MPEQLEMFETRVPQRFRFRSGSMEEYTLAELGSWVHLLAKRACQRTTTDGRNKDLLAARAYLNVMEDRISKLMVK